MYLSAVRQFLLADIELSAPSLDLGCGSSDHWCILGLAHAQECVFVNSFMHLHIWYKTRHLRWQRAEFLANESNAQRSVVRRRRLLGPTGSA